MYTLEFQCTCGHHFYDQSQQEEDTARCPSCWSLVWSDRCLSLYHAAMLSDDHDTTGDEKTPPSTCHVGFAEEEEDEIAGEQSEEGEQGEQGDDAGDDGGED